MLSANIKFSRCADLDESSAGRNEGQTVAFAICRRVSLLDMLLGWGLYLLPNPQREGWVLGMGHMGNNPIPAELSLALFYICKLLDPSWDI